MRLVRTEMHCNWGRALEAVASFKATAVPPPQQPEMWGESLSTAKSPKHFYCNSPEFAKITVSQSGSFHPGQNDNHRQLQRVLLASLI